MSDFKMPKLNQWTGAGRLVRDPELRVLSSGKEVTSFSLAVTERWKKQDGEKGESTAFVPCKAWGQTAQFVNKYFKKGRPILVQGKLVTESWEKDGQKRSQLIMSVRKAQFMDWVEDKDEGGGHE